MALKSTAACHALGYKVNRHKTEAIWPLFNSGIWDGYTDNYVKVAVPGDESLIGKIVKMKISKAGYPYNEGHFVRVLDELALT